MLTFLTHTPTSLKSRFWQGAQSAHVIKMAPRTRMVMQQAGDVPYVVDVHLREALPVAIETFKILPLHPWGVLCRIESLKFDDLFCTGLKKPFCIYLHSSIYK